MFVVDNVLEFTKYWPALSMLHLLKCSSSNDLSIK